MVGRLSAGLHITTNKPIEMRRVPDQQPHLGTVTNAHPGQLQLRHQLTHVRAARKQLQIDRRSEAEPGQQPRGLVGRLSWTARSASSIGVPPQILCTIRPTEAAVIGQERPTAPPAITSPSEDGV